MLDLLAGYIFSFATHEAGHILMSYPCGGYYKRWDFKDFPGTIYLGGSRRAITCGVLAGSLTQISVSYKAKERNTDFWKGVYYGGLLHMFVYSLSGGGDFKTLGRITPIEDKVWRFYIGSMTLTPFFGLSESFQVSYGSHIEYNTKGLIKHGLRLSLFENSKQNLRLEASVGASLEKHLEFGIAFKTSIKELEKSEFMKIIEKIEKRKFYLVDVKRGYFVYTSLRKDFLYGSFYLGQEENFKRMLPTSYGSSVEKTFKVYPEVGIELYKKNWHAKVFWSSFSQLGLSAGMSF